MNELRHGCQLSSISGKYAQSYRSIILERNKERRALSHHFPLGAEEGVTLERLVLVGGDEGEDAVVRRVRRAVGDPGMELKMAN